MDRRQRKTRAAIYSAFIELLDRKDFSKITVGEIIEAADVGRATFYAHFETKDFLLREMCVELFKHISGESETHYKCDLNEPFFLHLLRHIKNNDDNILKLLRSRNNELFLGYFRKSLEGLVAERIDRFGIKTMGVPKDFLVNFVSLTFTGAVLWWAEREFAQSPEQISAYFSTLVSEKINNFCVFS